MRDHYNLRRRMGAAVLLASLAVLVGTAGRATAAPVLTFQEVAPGYGGDGIVITPDSRFVYTNQGPGPTGAVTGFSRDVVSGSLTFIEQFAGINPWWRGSVSPDGRHLYLGASGGDGFGRVIVYAINPLTGQLTHLQDVVDGVPPNTGLARTTDVAVSPDGRHAYAAAAGDLFNAHQPSAVVAFVRDDDPMSPTFGMLSFVNAVFSPPAMSGSWYARAIMSPDGKHLYVTAYEDSAVSVFSRNVTTGEATYVGRVKQGENGILGFYRPAGMALSLGGEFFTVASWGDGVITTLRRETGTGALTFSEVEALPSGAVQPAELVMGAGSTRLYGVAWDRGVSVSLVDPSSGAVTHHQQFIGGPGGDPGLESVIGTVAPGVSPDGRHLYVTMTTPPAIAVFAITCGNGAIDPDEGCDDGNSSAGDGCSSACDVEECWGCSGAGPGSCAPLGAGTGCSSDGNACRDDTCDGGGYCAHPPVSDGLTCDDLVACTLGDECRSGECRGTAPTCGDGTLTPGCEQCDDGNVGDGDGCAADCSLFEKFVDATLESYGTLTTDTESDGATPASPIEVAVTTPNAGYVSIYLSGGQPPPGVLAGTTATLGFFGTRIDVEAPENIAAGDGATSGTTPESRPLVFVYRIDASLIPPGVDATTIAVPRNGVAAPPCLDTSGAAVPDPCVSERATLPDGDIELTVLSTHASKWNLAAAIVVTAPTATPTSPPSTPTPTHCAPAPAPDCEAASRSKLDIRNSSDDSKDSVQFKWSGGSVETDQQVFADPTHDTTYAVCIYDATGRKGETAVPPTQGWKPTRHGYQFKDALAKVLLKSGVPGKTKLLFKGKGSNLPDPIDTAMSGMVVVQVRNLGNGRCWQDSYATPLVSDATRYKAKRK